MSVPEPCSAPSARQISRILGLGPAEPAPNPPERRLESPRRAATHRGHPDPPARRSPAWRPGPQAGVVTVLSYRPRSRGRWTGCGGVLASLRIQAHLPLVQAGPRPVRQTRQAQPRPPGSKPPPPNPLGPSLHRTRRFSCLNRRGSWFGQLLAGFCGRHSLLVQLCISVALELSPARCEPDGAPGPTRRRRHQP